MFKIVEKEVLAEDIIRMEIDAPLIAQKAKAGQFVVLRTHEKGERFPLTIAGNDPDAGTITIIFQEVGRSTRLLGQFNEGDELPTVVGPLGVASEFDPDLKKAVVIGGGLGCAIALPQARALSNMGVSVDIIAGFRTKDIVILEDEMNEIADNLYITTDDGSYSHKGFVTQVLKERLEEGVPYGLAVAVGPIPMMKAVSEMTKEYDINTRVSMNPVMIDGTGMCGGCRIEVGGETKFACVDGPDFDGHEVNFDAAMRRLSMYDGLKEREEDCNLIKLSEEQQ